MSPVFEKIAEAPSTWGVEPSVRTTVARASPLPAVRASRSFGKLYPGLFIKPPLFSISLSRGVFTLRANRSGPICFVLGVRGTKEYSFTPRASHLRAASIRE
jgi:hypothetical protein